MLAQNSEDFFGCIVIGCTAHNVDPAVFFGAEIGQLGGGEIAVGDKNYFAVRCAQFGVDHVDFQNRTINAGGVDVIANFKRLGGQNLDAARQVGQAALYGERNGQTGDA